LRRRAFLGSALALASLPALAATRPVRIGWVVGSTQAATQPYLAGLRDGLRDLGYVEGSNLVVEERYADDVRDRVPGLVRDIAGNVDLIVTQAWASWDVVQSPTNVPVVFVFSADPVEAGFAQSYARPAGRATGITLMSVEMNGKRLELLREIMPELRRAALIASPDHRGEHLERENSEEAAHRLGIEIQYFPVRNATELEASFAPLAAGKPEAVLAVPDPITVAGRQRIIEIATAQRIPTVSGWAVFAESGALCTYGPKLVESYKRAAYFVDRILKGAKPADLPIERPSVFELVVNLKTAAALELALPKSVLARADEVIE